MNDLDVMIRAKQYIESLAKGIDPITGNEVAETDCVNNVRISRCLFYTADVLQRVIDNGGEVQRTKLKRADKAGFSLTDEQTESLKPAEDDLSLSKTIGIINAQIDDFTMKKLQRRVVVAWLKDKNLIKEVIINGKTRYDPTPEGELIGIKLVDYHTPGGSTVKFCAFSPEAQQFIFDNLDSIIASSAE